MTNSNEKNYIVGLKHDDINAFEKLFNNYQHKIYNFSKSLLGSQIQAEEITQEVFIALWNNRHKLDENGSFSSYIFKITRNQVNNYISKSLHKKIFLDYFEKNEEKPQTFTENEVLFNELKIILERSIEKLPPKRKNIYRLNREDGLTYKQIAEQLNISENTVDTQMRKAIEFIKDTILEEYK